ncbi:MAG: membrane protein insertion efficiency factor YidD [Planctomycetes bacterium]|nr:membrane protein insertion efficiency factor YidD [Planctomycetota bacterium]
MNRHIPWRLRSVLLFVSRLPAWALIGLARLYQLFLSPIFGRQCRFYPSCSEYFIQAVRKYGAIRGTWRGLRRILRCHPWHPGGYDPP